MSNMFVALAGGRLAAVAVPVFW